MRPALTRRRRPHQRRATGRGERMVPSARTGDWTYCGPREGGGARTHSRRHGAAMARNGPWHRSAHGRIPCPGRQGSMRGAWLVRTDPGFGECVLLLRQADWLEPRVPCAAARSVARHAGSPGQRAARHARSARGVTQPCGVAAAASSWPATRRARQCRDQTDGRWCPFALERLDAPPEPPLPWLPLLAGPALAHSAGEAARARRRLHLARAPV